MSLRSSLANGAAFDRYAAMYDLFQNNLQEGLAVLQHTATHCNTLQHTATHCNTQQAMYDMFQNNLPEGIAVLQHTAIHCNTLQRAATHCNTLQHPATHCSTRQHTATHKDTCRNTQRHTAQHCNTLQRTAVHCNTHRHTNCKTFTTLHLIEMLRTISGRVSRYCNTWHKTATHYCNILLQHTAATHCCITLQYTATLQHTATQVTSDGDPMWDLRLVKNDPKSTLGPSSLGLNVLCATTTTRCNIVQHNSIDHVLQHAATHTNVRCTHSFVYVQQVQRAATRCNTVQHTRMYGVSY